MKPILGIDPGTQLDKFAFGYIQVVGYLWRLGDCDTITLPRSGAVSLGARLNELRHGMVSRVALHPPGAIVVEVPGSGQRNNNKALIKVCGVVEQVAAMYGIPYHEYVTSTIKMVAAGHGHAKKPAVALAVERFLGCGPIGNDEISDALAAAVCHAIKTSR